VEVYIGTSEVKFLDCSTINISEGVLQVCACRSRTKVGGSTRSDTVVVSTVNDADYELDKILGKRGETRASDDFSSALQEIKSFWVPGGV